MISSFEEVGTISNFVCNFILRDNICTYKYC